MGRTFVAAALLFTVLAFALGQTRSKQMDRNSQTERELTRMEREFGEAITRKDTAKLDRFLAEDFAAIVAPEARVVNKAQVIADVASPEYEVDSLVNDEIRVRVFGDAAVATGRGTGKGRYKGQDISGQFRYTRVWVKRRGRWQAVAAQSSLVTQQ